MIPRPDDPARPILSLLFCAFSWIFPGPALATDLCRENAVLQMERGDNGAALQALASCPSPQPDDVRWTIARLHFLAGDLTSSKALLKDSDDDPLPLLTRAQILAEEGRFDEAVALYDRLLRTAPWRPLVLLLKGEVLERAGHQEQAEKVYGEAVAEDASFTEARPALARLLERRNDAEAAWKQWDRVAAANAEDADAKSSMARLKPLLPRPPEKILPVFTLPSHRGAPCPSDSWRAPLLRVGVATDGQGRPQPIKEAVFRTSSAFKALSRDGRLLASGAPQERWTVRRASASAVLLDPAGAERARFSGSLTISLDRPAENTLIVDGLAFASGFVWSGAADKELRGDLEIALHGSGLRLTAVMPVEAYLYGVVGAEMPPTWPAEALKAQAVVARTYAAARRAAHPHGKDGYDVCDEQHCQVYAGASREAASVRAAVDGTRGKILSFEGRPAQAFYASNCGGHGRAAVEVWGGKVPYLEGYPEAEEVPSTAWDFRHWLMTSPPAACRTSSFVPAAHHRWARVVDLTGMDGLTLLSRGAAGHVTGLRLEKGGGPQVLESDGRIRRFLGKGPLRSSLFTIEVETRGGRPRRAYVFGGGWGHGVGLCQAGAAGRAEAGAPHEAILAHYFPGTTLAEDR